MEPTQRKPVNKRRRWLFTALFLAFVAVGVWQFWSRGDARFVGKWRQETNSIFELHSDGSGAFHISLAGGGYGYQPMRWYVQDERFFMDTWSSGFENQAHYYLRRLLGRTSPTPYDIIEVQPDLLKIRQQDGHIQNLVRVE